MSRDLREICPPPECGTPSSSSSSHVSILPSFHNIVHNVLNVPPVVEHCLRKTLPSTTTTRTPNSIRTALFRSVRRS
jgi:hypothetical protein